MGKQKFFFNILFGLLSDVHFADGASRINVYIRLRNLEIL